MLIPSTCTALLTRAYTSTLYTSLVSHKTQFLCFVLALKVWWSIIRPPQTAAHAALCGLLLLRRSHMVFQERPPSLRRRHALSQHVFGNGRFGDLDS
jgi:hypothetical protein